VLTNATGIVWSSVTRPQVWSWAICMITAAFKRSGRGLTWRTNLWLWLQPVPTELWVISSCSWGAQTWLHERFEILYYNLRCKGVQIIFSIPVLKKEESVQLINASLVVNFL
jgi:hypothetical protein